MCPDRPRSTCRRTAIAILGVGALLALPVHSEETIAVPGGAEAVRRVLDLSPQPALGFVRTLNLKLLEAIRADGDWEKIESRLLLDRTMETLEDLVGTFPEPTVLSLAGPTERRTLAAMAPSLGYEVAGRGVEARLVAAKGPEAAWRRRVVSALGVPAAGLRSGRTVELRIPVEEAALPLSLTTLSKAAGRDLGPDSFLRDLAHDQELGYLLASHGRIPGAAWNRLLEAAGNGSLRDRAARLYRYGWSVQRLGDGRLVVPGGSPSLDLWLDVAGLAPTSPSFEDQWFSAPDSRRAHLWHALTPVGDATAAAWLQRLESAGGIAETRSTSRRGWEAPRGGDDGFPGLVRSLPTDDLGIPTLAGQTRFWLAGLGRPEIPVGEGDLEKVIRAAPSTDESTFRVALAALATPENEAAPDRLRIAAAWLRDRPEQATPGVIVALTRGAVRFEPALAALHDVAPRDPGTIQRYLLAVAHLDSLSHSAETELLAQNFQAVVEWFRRFAHARSVPAPALESLFDQWITLHAGARRPADIEDRNLGFLERTLAEIEAPPADFPGRGPLERKLLWAWTGNERSTFEWEGLVYGEHRARDLAERIVRRLEEAELPSLDDFERLRRELAEVLEACRVERIEIAPALATRALRTVRQFPSLDVPTGELDPRHALAAGSWKGSLQSTLIEIARVHHPGLLSSLGSRLRAEMELSAPLRTTLLSPLFAAGLGNQERMVFQTKDLVLTHELFFGHRGSMLDSKMWQPAARVQSREEHHGAVIRGHLGNLPTALAAATLSIAAGADTGLPTESWYTTLVAQPWPRVAPGTLDLVTELEAAGTDIVVAAASDSGTGPSPRYEVARRIPLARLERAPGGAGPTTTVSERVMLGLAAIEPDGFGMPEALPLTPERRRRIDALREAVGPHWRTELDRLGVPTPRLNGRNRPWIGTWPPYEALEHEFSTRALHERMLVDLRLTVAAFLARADLPSVAGADITWKLFFDRPTDLRLETAHDWESFIHWLQSLGDEPWRDVFRECLTDGYYRLQPV